MEVLSTVTCPLMVTRSVPNEQSHKNSMHDQVSSSSSSASMISPTSTTTSSNSSNGLPELVQLLKEHEGSLPAPIRAMLMTSNVNSIPMDTTSEKFMVSENPSDASLSSTTSEDSHNDSSVELHPESDCSDSADKKMLSDGADRANSRLKRSSFKGVFKCGRKFKAQIQTQGVQHYLGLYDTEEDAARVYDAYARQMLGTRAKTNFELDAKEAALIAPNVDMESIQKRPRIDGKAQNKRLYIGVKSRRKNSKDIEAGDVSNTNVNTNTGMESAPVAPAAIDAASNVLPMANALNGFSMLNPAFMGMFGPSGMTTSQLQSTLALMARNPLMNLGLPQQSLLIPSVDSAISGMDWRNPYRLVFDPMCINAALGASPMPTVPRMTVTTPVGVSNDENWHDEVYHWHGRMDYDEQCHRIVWRGNWLGSFSLTVSDEQVSASPHRFEYRSATAVPKSSVINDMGIFSPRDETFTGSFTYIQNGNPLNFLESGVQVQFDEISNGGQQKSMYCVYGRGMAQFGTFLFYGTYCANTRELKVKRQFLKELDERHHLSFSDMRVRREKIFQTRG